MALTKSQREDLKNVDKVIESLLPENNVNSDNIKINEAARLLYDLEKVEEVIGDKKFNYTKVSEIRSAIDTRYGIDVKIMLIDNKNASLKDEDNLLSYTFDFGNYSDYGIVRVEKSSETNCGFGEFIGITKKGFVEGNTEDSVESIIDLCDYSMIYDIYSKQAEDLLKQKLPDVYSLFTGGHLYKKKLYEKSGNETLYVTFMPGVGKFEYGYNPKFILRCAIQEYTVRGNCYHSLQDCYVYNLAFFIAHEMLHIILNNTAKYGNNGGVDEVGLGDHRTTNIVMDSYINTEVGKRLTNVRGVYSENGKENPIPMNGYGSSMWFRCQHNVGLKKFKDEYELLNKISEVFKRFLRSDSIKFDFRSYFMGFPLELYEGIDFFVNFKISPMLTQFRKSSGTYQKLLSELFKALSDGIAFSNTSLSEIEKASDLDVLPEGTLVRIRNKTDICIIKGYNNDGNYVGTYTLNKTEISNVKRSVNSDGSILCSNEYSDSGEFYGNLFRNGFILYDPAKDSWVENSKPTQEEDKKLSKEDLESIKNKPENIIDFAIKKYNRETVEDVLSDVLITLQKENNKQDAISSANTLINRCNGKSNEECIDILTKDVYVRFYRYMRDFESKKKKPVSKEEKEAKKMVNDVLSKLMPDVKNVSVGTIVYLKAVGKFGRITSINNGKFRIEEVKEGIPKIIDDSDNYK